MEQINVYVARIYETNACICDWIYSMDQMNAYVTGYMDQMN